MNAEKFFASIRASLFNGTMSQTQVDGLRSIRMIFAEKTFAASPRPHALFADGECLGRWDSGRESVLDYSSGNPKMTARCADRMEMHSVDIDRYQDFPIFLPLDSRRYPSAVGRLVVALGTFTINLVNGRWFRSHVRKKLNEGAIPLIADTNAFGAVFREILALLVVTPTLDAKPSAIFWRYISASFMSVFNGGHRNTYGQLITNNHSGERHAIL